MSEHLPTPDLCDKYEGEVQAISLQFQHFGLLNSFFGQVVTVKCFEDNSKVKELLNSPGQGKVLLVDGGGSMSRALMGDMLAEAAIENGWSGIVIAGCIRDVQVINQLAIGVKALGIHPMKTEKLGVGEVDVPVVLGHLEIFPGQYLYADLNGVIVSNKLL